MADPRPRLGWLLRPAGRERRQTAYRITLETAEGTAVWDSGEVAGASHEVRYAGPALRPATRHRWRVRVADEGGRWTGWSPYAEFETAPAELAGTWIGGPGGPEPLLRRAFTLTGGKVARARLYAAGAGYAELSLNGRKVGDEVLSPGFTRYDKRVQYVTHDVTDLLRAGGNVLGARLGRGFYGVTQETIWDWHRAPWTAEPRLLARLDVTYADGTSQAVVTDGAWRRAEGPVRCDSLYGGETYDAREERPGWDAPGFDDTSWRPAAVLPAPGGVLVPADQEPIRVTGTLRPVAVTAPGPGVHVFELPVNIAGWARIRVRGPAGTKVTLRYGERLDEDGRVVAVSKHVTGRFQTDEYVLAGRDAAETWEPRYTYKGFQYVEVTGWPGEPALDDLDGREVHSDLAPAGSFDCSNPLFDRLRTMTGQTVVNNWHGIPTDTPMYEKNGWTGDAQLTAATQMAEYDLRRPFTKWLGEAFNAAFLKGDAYVTGTDPGYRQSSALIALALGLSPAESERAITDRLVRDVEERDGHLDTGALGTRYLLTELTRRGHGELAYRVATRRTYPSWGHWVEHGATTLWERWDLDTRSRDHLFLGAAVVAWFYEDLAGIRPAAPGYDRILIAPHPVGDLTFLRARVRTPHGPVAVEWRRSESGLRLDAEIPVGATAEIRLPGNEVVEVGSGSYTFEGEEI